MKKTILLTLLCLAQLGVKSQITPVGTSTNVEKLIDYPVSYNTGLPSIDIPLYTIDFGGTKIPINLSYHASGLKLAQKSGLVGAGWSISTDFQISRTVRGREDEFYPMPNLDSMYLELTSQNNPITLPTNTFHTKMERDAYLAKFVYPDDGLSSTSVYPPEFQTNVLYDSEVDIFRYNTFSSSGRFIFHSRNPFQITALDDNYGKQFSYAQNQFTIKDTQGVQYVFGDNGQNQTVNIGNRSVTTGWALSKAYALNGDSILFTYGSNIVSEKKFGKSVYIKEGCKDCFPYGITVPNYVKKDSADNSFAYEILPADIVFPEGKVSYLFDFIKVGGVDESLIKEINITDLDNSLIRKINLYYQLGTRFALLDSVKISGGTEKPMVYKLNYQLTDENNVPFDSVALRADYWGYLSKRFNLTPASKKTDMPFLYGLAYTTIFNPDSSYPYTRSLSTYQDKMEFDDKNIAYSTPPIYLLKQITYPTGSAVEYNFEHHYLDIGGGPGYRIKEMKINDGLSNRIQRRTYTYGGNQDDGPQQGNWPLGAGIMVNYSAINSENSARQGVEIGVKPDAFGNPESWMLYNTYSFSNQYNGNLDFAGINENHVFYTQVTERTYNDTTAISKTEFVFDSVSNIVKKPFYYFQRNQSPNIGGRGQLSRTFTPENFEAVVLGYKQKIRAKTNYVKFQNAWKKVSKEEYNYMLGPVTAETLPSFGGYLNLRVNHFAKMNGDPRGNLVLADVYSSGNIESFFDFHRYYILVYGENVLLNKILTTYTDQP